MSGRSGLKMGHQVIKYSLLNCYGGRESGYGDAGSVP